MSTEHRRPSRDENGSSGHSPRPASAEPAPPPSDLFPTLSTLDSAGRENTLENLAQHAVELHDSAMDPVPGDVNDLSLANFHHEDNSFFTAEGEARFGMLEEAAAEAEGKREHEHGQHEGFEGFDGAALGEAADAVANVANEVEGARDEMLQMGRMRHGHKRRREEDGVVGPVENGEPIDPIKMKKESHVSLYS